MDPLPDGTHLIHIGPQKTGSTSVQAALHRARATLLEHGVCYPGPGMRPVEAMGAGLGFPTPKGGPRNRIEAWESLLEQVNDPAHRLVVVSHEGFGRAGEAQVARVVSELGGDHPHVVAVARRYDRLMPSQWQQRVKARQRLSYDEWLRVVLGDAAPRNPVWRNLWVPHDTVRLLERWGAAVGLENVTLIVADDRNRDLLPRTFESLLGIPEGVLAPGGEVRNRSLSYGEVELLRALNVIFHRRGWSDRDYYLLVKRGVIPRLVRSEKVAGDPTIPPLPAWAARRLAEIGDQRVDELAGLGVNVVGDLESLHTAAPAEDTGDPEVLPVVPLEVTARALEGLSARAIAGWKRGRTATGKKPGAKPTRPEPPVSTPRRLARALRRRLSTDASR